MKEEKNTRKLEEVLDHLVEELEDQSFGEADLERLCQQYPTYEKELRSSWSLWTEIGELEKTDISPSHRDRFYETLTEFQSEETSTSGKYIHINTVFRWAAIFVIGIGLGFFLNSDFLKKGNDRFRNGERQLISTLTTSESASGRLVAIQGIKGINRPKDHVFDALYTTLINDPNVNVRLSAIEAMLHFVESPRARELLVQSLAYQDSPIVQITLAEVIIKLQEEGSVEEIRKLLNSENLDVEVRMHLEEALNL